MISEFKKQGGNTKVNGLYEAHLGNEPHRKATESSDRGERAEFIRDKYEEKRWHIYNPKPPRSPILNKLSCPKCTFGNGIKRTICEMCGYELPPADLPEHKRGISTPEDVTVIPDEEPPQPKRKMPSINLFRKRGNKSKEKKSSLGDPRTGRHLLTDGDEEGEGSMVDPTDTIDVIERKSPPQSPTVNRETSILPIREGPPIAPNRQVASPPARTRVKSNKPPAPSSSTPVQVDPSQPVRPFVMNQSKAALFRVAATKMTEEERKKAMQLVKSGKLTVDQVIELVMKREQQKNSAPKSPAPKSPSPMSPAPPPQVNLPRMNPVQRAHTRPEASPSMNEHFKDFDGLFSEKKNQLKPMPVTPQSIPGVKKVLQFYPGQMGCKTDGIKITEVSPGGQAAQRGVRAGWVIVEVEGKAPKSQQDIIRELRNITAKRQPFKLGFLIPHDLLPIEPHSSSGSDEPDGSDDSDGPVPPYSQPGTSVPYVQAGQDTGLKPQADFRPTLEWKTKFETVVTQTVQAVMLLRKDSIQFNERLSALESKGLDRGQSTNQQLQGMMIKLQQRNEALLQKMVDLQKENRQLKDDFSKLRVEIKNTGTISQATPQPYPQASNATASTVPIARSATPTTTPGAPNSGAVSGLLSLNDGSSAAAVPATSTNNPFLTGGGVGSSSNLFTDMKPGAPIDIFATGSVTPNSNIFDNISSSGQKNSIPPNIFDGI